jgi:hypothetical protein
VRLNIRRAIASDFAGPAPALPNYLRLAEPGCAPRALPRSRLSLTTTRYILFVNAIQHPIQMVQLMRLLEAWPEALLVSPDKLCMLFRSKAVDYETAWWVASNVRLFGGS